jgi:Asp-tRNA(Asn)/Glu-tRNA(Gln) amidotransferase A subunit family amidase
LQDLTVSGTAKLIKAKELSPDELTKLFLERVHRFNPTLNAYITVTADHALRRSIGRPSSQRSLPRIGMWR